MRLQSPYPWTYLDRSFPRAFLKSLRKSIPRKIDAHWGSIDRDIQKAAEEIFSSNQTAIVDSAAQGHVLMTSYILASYRTLLSHSLTETEAMEVISSAFSSYGEFWMKWGMKLALFFSKDPMRMIKRFAESRGKATYGASFQIENEGDGNSTYTSSVKRCGYYDFFKRNGCPELTGIMCRWDLNWANQISKDKHGIIFERPTTIATGDEACRFSFKRSQAD